MQEETEGAVAFSSHSHSPDALKSLNQSHSPDALKSLGARPALLRACKYVNVQRWLVTLWWDKNVRCTLGRRCQAVPTVGLRAALPWLSPPCGISEVLSFSQPSSSLVTCSFHWTTQLEDMKPHSLILHLFLF